MVMMQPTENWSEDIIPVETAVTLSGLFRERVRRSRDAIAYRYFDKNSSGWIDLRWSAIERQVQQWRQGLAAERLQPGDRVAILLKNSPEWVVFDQAALSLGLVTVPLYTDDRPDNAAYVLQDSQSKVLLVQSGSHWRRIASSVGRLEHIRRVVLLDDQFDCHENSSDERVVLSRDWLSEKVEDVDWHQGKPDELASIVYTSGTTGRPKGVMLSHSNMLSVAHAALTMMDVYQQDSFMSFLPLSHTLERTAGYYLPMMAGSTVAYSRSINQLASDLVELQPTIMIAVPVSRMFIGLDVPLLQGYGLTESSPVISVNTFDSNDPASVGIPLRGVEVRVGDNSELLMRGPGVMLGYWNNHVATREVIDAGGWLHTGDQARIENDHIYITGRIKDILVLSNGEKVPPGDMESAIALHSLIEQVLVVGEGKPYLSALVVLNGESWFGAANSLGLDPMARGSLTDSKLHHYLLKQIKQQLHDFPGYAKVRKVIPMLEPWTMDDDLVTPTLKIKRAKVIARFTKEIEALYNS